MDIVAEAKRVEGEILRLYHHFHAHPELSFQESETARTVADELTPLGYTLRTGVAGDGIVADLPGEAARPTVAFRADMDALPIQEETGLVHASCVPGVMHACGHDTHTAMLLGAARVFSERRDALKVNVRLIFQPGEESPPGRGRDMVAQGAMDGVDEVYAIHVAPALPAGAIGTRAGAIMAAVDDFEITVRGKGGHGARPHETVDPILIAARLIEALHTLPSRRVNPIEPVVISVCKFQAGTAYNIIPDKARMRGTVRTVTEKQHEAMPELIRQMGEGVCRASDGEFEMDSRVGYPVTVNDPGAVTRLAGVAAELFGPEPGLVETPLEMGAEDFSYFLQRAPGVFIRLGVRNEAVDAVHPNHSPRFRVDESVLWKGTALLVGLALLGKR